MIVVGIDEVGRGCWAGPLVAAAVILESPIQGLKDSKLLSKKRREELAVQIQEQALFIGLGWVEALTIDKEGITTSVKRAVELSIKGLERDYDSIIIDGSINYLPNNAKATAVIKADTTVPSVSAASIVAKVARDKYMAEMAAIYKGYGFDTHVGYGTSVHHAALKLLGTCKLHRMSFKPVRAIAELAEG